MKLINLKFGRDEIKNQFHLESEDDITFFWSTNFHLKAFLLYKDIAEFLDSLKEELALDFRDDNPGSKTAINLIFKGRFCVNLEISEKHSAKLSFCEYPLEYGRYVGLFGLFFSQSTQR